LYCTKDYLAAVIVITLKVVYFTQIHSQFATYTTKACRGDGMLPL